MSHRITTCPFRVEPFTEDILGQLSWGVLGNLLLRISEIHAATHRFGYAAITPHNKAWVLSRLSIAMEQRPHTYEEFHISTWVDSFFRQFTTRQYQITTLSGETLGYANSVWAMIDTESRTPVNIAAFDTEDLFPTVMLPQQTPLAEMPRFRLHTTTPTAHYTTAYSDIDINGHVNSIRYLQLLLNLFPLPFHLHHHLERIDIIYAKESHAGECLALYLEEQDRNTYVAQINNEEEEILVKALFRFTKIEK